MRVYIRENSWIAKIAARVLGTKNMAITIGRTIYLYRADREEFLQNEAWIRHELAHVRQFRQYGFIRFLFLYLLESLRKGYHNNKWEIEAREAEQQTGRTDFIDFR